MAGQNDFTSQFISFTYQRLLQLSGSGEVTDGTGSLVSFLPLSVNNALTASYVPGVTATTPGGGLWSIQFNSASTFQGSSNLLFNNASSTLTLTGSILISGSVTEAYISTLNWIDFNPNIPAGSPAFNTGRLHWVDDTKTLGLDTDVNGSVIELGHQHVVRVVNQTGVAISQGTVVYISGSQGTRPGIATASYTDENDSATTLGFVMHNIAGTGGNRNGYVVTRGMLRDVNTFGLPAGASLYLSSSGQYSTTKPQAPLHDVRLGKVIVGGSTNAGVIYVDIQNGYELDELHNVRIIGDTTGDLIVKSGSLWINSKQLSGNYGITGSLNITGSLFINGVLVSPSGAETDPIFVAKSASLATTGSNTFKGTQVISGSLNVTSGITGSLLGTSSYATFAAAATTANFATSATQASTVRIEAQDTTTNAFKSFLLPREVAPNPFDPYYSRLDETPLKLNPAKNTIRFTPNDTGQGAALEVGDPAIPNSGQLVVHGPLWAESLNTLPGTITFVDTINTASFNKLTDLSFVNNALVLTTGSYSGSFIGNLTGTSSWANNYNETDPVFTAKSASLATTGSNQFRGNQIITGSLDVSGSFGLFANSLDPVDPPNRIGLFYFTDTNFYVSLQ